MKLKRKRRQGRNDSVARPMDKERFDKNFAQIDWGKGKKGRGK